MEFFFVFIFFKRKLNSAVLSLAWVWRYLSRALEVRGAAFAYLMARDMGAAGIHLQCIIKSFSETDVGRGLLLFCRHFSCLVLVACVWMHLLLHEGAVQLPETL